MTDIEVVIKAKDEFSKVFDTATRATAEMTQKFIEGGKTSKGFSVNVIKAQAELDAYAEKAKRAAEETGDFGKSIESADKFGEGFVKQLKGMAKGFIGVSGAFMAGRAVVRFVEASFAAADAAGQLSPIFKEAQKESDRLKVAVGTQLGNALEGTTKTMVKLTNATADNFELTNRLIEARDRGIITGQEFNRMHTAMRGGQKANIRILEDLTKRENEFNASQEKDIELMLGKTAAMRALSAERRTAQHQFSEMIKLAGIEKAQRVFEAGLGERGALDITGAVTGVQEVGGLLTQIDLFDAGVLETQNHYAMLVRSFQQGLVDQKFVAQEAEKIAVIYAQQALAAGTVNTEWEAAKLLVEALGVTGAEALEMIRGIAPELEEIPGTLEAMTKEFEGVNEEIDNIATGLGEMNNKRYRVFIDVIAEIQGIIGGGGGGGGGGVGIIKPGQATPTRLEFAHGGGGIVPSGFPNDSFPIGLTSGESFDVRTPGQQNSGDMSVLEDKFDRLSSDMKNMVLAITQAIAERG